ncbi:MAG TPA: hypothetical protein VEA35_00630 [Ramlibacter sp.]|nr:hypothetical protein [Ramlibacter sp.]
MANDLRERAEKLVDAMGNIGVRNRRAKKIDLLTAALRDVRREAIEAAAKVAVAVQMENHTSVQRMWAAGEVAIRIRALLPPTTPKGGE